MLLTDAQIKEFQEIYFDTYGTKIGKKEAYDKAIRLVRLVSVVYKTRHKMKLNKTKIR